MPILLNNIILPNLSRMTTTLLLVAATGSLTACQTAQPQVQSSAKPGASDTAAMHGMDHGGMNHQNMDLGPADANYDLRFVDAMLPHHQGAVVMAKVALQKSTHPEVKQLAANIIKAQDQEIAEMKQWRKQWYPQASETAMSWQGNSGQGNSGHMMAMSAEQRQGMMMSMDLGASDPKFDSRFLNAMIPHHEGAVVMAKDVLTKSKRPELQKLAQSIISSQQAEISQMQQWRKSWYP